MSTRKALLSSVVLLLATGLLPAQTQSRVFLPSQGSQNITVLDGTTLANVGAVAASSQAFLTVGTPDASRYYIIARTPTRTLTIVNGANLNIVRQVDLGTNAGGAAVTPDGKFLLLSAGFLRVYNTATDQEAALPMDVGGGPTDIEVNNDSTRAYVMATGAGVISIINLTNFTRVNQIAIGFPLSIALTPDNSRLLVLTSNKLVLIDTATNNVRGEIEIPVLAGKVIVTPDSSKALVVNTGSAPFNIAQLVNLSTQAVQPITGGAQGFDQVVIADNATAFGRVAVTNTVARIDLATATSTVQTYGAGTRSLDISPSGKTVFLASFDNREVQRVDVASNLALNRASVGVAPTAISAVIASPTTNAATMTLNGGDRQNLIPGRSTPVPLSVRVTTSDGSPVFNYPVTFATTATVTITPAQPVRTNSRGIAQVMVSAPSVAALGGNPDAAAALSADPADIVEQVGVQNITITATAGGTGGALFRLTISSGTGLVSISGDFQITRQNVPFALPLVVRYTDETGAPVPKDTEVIFIATNAGVTPPSQVVKTDAEGFAKAEFTGGNLVTCAGFGGIVCQTIITVQGVLGSTTSSVSFTVQTAINVPDPPVVLSGNEQSADVGKAVPFPLQVQLTNSFGPVALVGVYWTVVSGPAGESSAFLNPAVSITGGSGVAATIATMGPRVGVEPVIIRASVPGIQGYAEFKLTVTGGPPERVTILRGDNQEGRSRTTLGTALAVRVFDFFGNPVPFPTQDARFPLRWEVSPSSAAQLRNLFSSADGEATAIVELGSTPGPFTVTATAGNGRAVFNLKVVSLPSAIVLVSGNNQRVAGGATAAEPLVTRVNDSSGSPVAGVPVTFSAPAGVTLVPADGTPANPAIVNTGVDGRAAVAVRFGATVPTGALTITASSSVGSVSFNFTVVGRVPVFTAASVVNAGSFRPGLVPLGIATLFGTGLSQVSGRVLPGGATSAQGITLTVNGRATPLFAIINESGQEQINFQTPAETATGTARVEVNNNGSVTAVDNVPVVRVQPGMFEYTPAGSAVRYAVVVKLDGSVVGPNNPAVRGSIVILFWTGGGPTTPSVGTGQSGPTPPAVTVGNAVIGLNNLGVPVLFSGLTPGFLGLYQINFTIPEEAPVGQSVSLDLVVDGVPSLQTSRIAIQ